MREKIFFLLFFFPVLMFAKWNNNYTFFSGSGGEDAGNAALNILSWLLTAFGAFLFFHSAYKLLGSNAPEDKTRGALFTNVFMLILSLLLIANQYVIKKILGV